MKLSELEYHQLQNVVRKSERRILTNWWLVTGPPGSGKTTLVEKFSDQGWMVVRDPGRAEFEAQMKVGRSPELVRKNYLDFQWKVFARSLSSIEGLKPQQRVIFDYGIAESLAFMKVARIPWNDTFLQAASCIRFAEVFLLDLVPENLPLKDDIRVESEIERRDLRGLFNEIYCALDNPPIHVPLMGTEARYQFLLRHLPSNS